MVRSPRASGAACAAAAGASAATAAGYFRQENKDGAVWKIDGFATRSLFDLYSNFTYQLDDQANGDQFNQRDRRAVLGGALTRAWSARRT